jgi:hypothetical protein
MSRRFVVQKTLQVSGVDEVLIFLMPAKVTRHERAERDHAQPFFTRIIKGRSCQLTGQPLTFEWGWNFGVDKNYLTIFKKIADECQFASDSRFKPLLALINFNSRIIVEDCFHHHTFFPANL